MKQFLLFYISNCPSYGEIVFLFPPFTGLSFLFLLFSGAIKRYYLVQTGISRKTFHFLTFFSVAILHAWKGLPVVCIFGLSTTAVVFFAIFKGEGDILYEAMAREKDAPFRTGYIVNSYLATLFGGLLTNYYFSNYAIAGYLVSGIADASGEVIGTKFGSRKYLIPLSGGQSFRTIEGSVSVFMFSTLCFLWILSSGSANWLLLATIGGIISTLVEAVSPHGWDNFSMQLIPSIFFSLC